MKADVSAIQWICLFILMSTLRLIQSNDSSCVCAREFHPVCGTDSNTYDNICLLKCKSLHVQGLSKAYDGTCCPKNLCPSSVDPICDSNGRTHRNECVFNRSACILRKTKNQHLGMAHKGICNIVEHRREECDVQCSTIQQSLCDATGKTHISECSFERSNCLLRNQRKLEVTITHFGPCKNARNQESEEKIVVGSFSEQSELAAIIDKTTMQALSSEFTAGTSDSLENTTTVKSLPFSIQKKNDDENQQKLVALDFFPNPADMTNSGVVVHVRTPQIHLQTNKIQANAVPTITLEDIEKSHNRSNDKKESMDKAVLLISDQPSVEMKMLPKTKSMNSNSSELVISFNVDDSYQESVEETSDRSIDSSLRRIDHPENITNHDETSNVRSIVSTILSTVNQLSISTTTVFPDLAVENTPISQPFDLNYPCSAGDCDKLWNPVCDSTGQTHRNLCLFKFHACKVHRLDGTLIELANEGECKKDKVEEATKCPICETGATTVQVCDNQNTTHNSICLIARFNCLKKEKGEEIRVLVHVGKCHSRSPIFSLKEEKCPTKCSTDQKPVCDEDGVTHRNFCSFQQQNCQLRKAGTRAPMLKTLRPCLFGKNITIANKENKATALPKLVTSTSPIARFDNQSTTNEIVFVCPKPTCGSDGLPVCDSEGNIHESICAFTYARCQSAQKGIFLSIQPDEKCVPKSCSDSLLCPTDGRPICGSDFITYENLCSFNRQRCKDNSLELLFKGKCNECLNAPCPTLPSDAADKEYVCDQDGTTRSLCEYRMISCIIERNYGLNLTIQYIGKCCDSIESCDSKPSSPICGNDRRTYKNKCLFDIENCRNSKLEVELMELLHDGPCTQEEEVTDAAVDIIRATDIQDRKEDDTEEHQRGDPECADECSNDYTPVCGTDEMTYTNLCVLNEARCKLKLDINVAYNGPCCDMDCNNNFSPVCDDRNVTHQNLCYFGKERCVMERITGKNISISKFDVCESSGTCNTDCSKTYEPVCTTTGETIVNRCELEKLNCYVERNISSGPLVEIDYEGECCSDEKCEYHFSPVCDTDDITHANECVFKQVSCRESRRTGRNITIQYKGQCCNQPCEPEIKPVCDGTTTHDNMCKFRIAQCEAERRGEVLALAYAGVCCAMPTGRCQRSAAVCDSEGQTHQNVCKFKQKKCVSEKTIKKQISIVHAGECCKIETCHKAGDAMCDNRGGTHASLCHFQNTKCIHDKIHPNNTIELAYRGSCCPSNCGNEWRPVCDQHGTVYRNRCFFKLRSCELQRKARSALLETPCPERRARSMSTHRRPV